MSSGEHQQRPDRLPSQDAKSLGRGEATHLRRCAHRAIHLWRFSSRRRELAADQPPDRDRRPVRLHRPGSERAFQQVPATGATVVRLLLSWRAVAPATITPAFDASNPEDPAYNWEASTPRSGPRQRKDCSPIVDISARRSGRRLVQVAAGLTSRRQPNSRSSRRRQRGATADP